MACKSAGSVWAKGLVAGPVVNEVVNRPCDRTASTNPREAPLECCPSPVLVPNHLRSVPMIAPRETGARGNRAPLVQAEAQLHFKPTGGGRGDGHGLAELAHDGEPGTEVAFTSDDPASPIGDDNRYRIRVRASYYVN